MTDYIDQVKAKALECDQLTKERTKLEVKIRQLEQASSNNGNQNEEKIRKLEEEHREVIEQKDAQIKELRGSKGKI